MMDLSVPFSSALLLDVKNQRDLGASVMFLPSREKKERRTGKCIPGSMVPLKI